MTGRDPVSANAPAGLSAPPSPAAEGFFRASLGELGQGIRPEFDPRPRRFPSLAKALPRYPVMRVDADPESVWLLADLHVGHEAVVRLSSRPYRDAREMANALFSNWAEAVGENDTAVILGDVAMAGGLTEASARLAAAPGRVCLVPGNHDVTGAGRLRIGGADAIAGMLYREGPPGLLFTHVPLAEVPDGWVNVHGHIHNAPSANTPHICVSVEHLGYRPVRLARLLPLAEALLRSEAPPGATTRERLQALAAARPAAREGFAPEGFAPGGG